MVGRGDLCHLIYLQVSDRGLRWLMINKSATPNLPQPISAPTTSHNSKRTVPLGFAEVTSTVLLF